MNTALSDSGAPPRGAVVITGASTGIGRACALSLDALGFRVFAGVRKAGDGESLRRASSARLTPIFIDVTDEQSISAAAESVSREVGDAGLVGLINNAGHSRGLLYAPSAPRRSQWRSDGSFPPAEQGERWRRHRSYAEREHPQGQP